MFALIDFAICSIDSIIFDTSLAQPASRARRLVHEASVKDVLEGLDALSVPAGLLALCIQIGRVDDQPGQQ